MMIERLNQSMTMNVWEVLLSVGLHLVLIAACLLLVFRSRFLAKTSQEEKQKSFRLFQEAADAIIILNKRGTITAVNPATERISGFTKAELTGKHFATLNIVRGASLKAAFKIFWEAVSGQTPEPYEFEIFTKDGSAIYSEVNASAMRRGQRIIGVQCVFRDVTRRVMAEKAVLKEKETAQRYLNIAGVILLALDLEGNVAMINKKGCEVIGLGEEEILGKNWCDHFIAEENRPAMKEVFRKLLAGNTANFGRIQNEVIAADGRIRVIAWHNSLIRDEEDRITGTLSSGEDITERRQADAFLNLQSTALNAAANAIVITDKEGIIQWVNPAFTKLTGYAFHEVKGQNPHVLKSGRHDGSFYNGLWNTILAGKVWHSEIVNRRKDGNLYTEEMTITPVLDARNRITNFIAIKQDISERKWAEDALRQQFTFLQKLIDTIPNPIFYKNRDGRYVGCNDAFERFIGMDRKSIMGKTVFDVTRKDYAERHHAKDLDLIEKGGVQFYETDVLHTDGTRRSVLFYKAAYSGTGQPIAGIVGIMLDITERKKLEKQIEEANQNMVKNEQLLRSLLKDLEKSNRELKETQNQLIQSEKLAAVGTLSSGIAHEIKNPLGVILLGAESLESQIQKGMPDLKKAGTRVEMIKKSAERANNIVIELLKFSRFSKIELSPVRLDEIIESALEIIKTHPKNKEVKIVKDFKVKGIGILGDRILLEQVFVNLSANAMDAIGEEGAVTIETSLADKKDSPSKKEIVVKVSDTGSGMSAEVARRIFEPFFTTKDPGKGTGLGLSTVYMIIERHNGSIRVESKPGQGTTFILTLPAQT